MKVKAMKLRIPKLHMRLQDMKNMQQSTQHLLKLPLPEMRRRRGNGPLKQERLHMDFDDDETTFDLSTAGYDADYQADFDRGFAEGAAGFRARFSAVIGCKHYAGREATAHALIFDTDLSADQIAMVLANTPAVASRSSLDGRGSIGLVMEKAAGFNAENGWADIVAKVNSELVPKPDKRS